MTMMKLLRAFIIIIFTSASDSNKISVLLPFSLNQFLYG